MRYAPRLRGERGIALVMAVLALVVIGALVAGTFFAGQLEQRNGLNSLFAAQAFEAAEAGAASTVAAWDAPTFNALPVGADTVLAPGGAALGRGVDYAVTVSRLSGTTFLVRSEGTRRDAAGGPLARRMVGLFTRLELPALDIQAALTADAAVVLGSAADVDGSDANPTGWAPDCPGAGAGLSQVRSTSPVQATSGPPPSVQRDTALGPGTFTTFGATSFDSMAAMATVQVSGTLTAAPLAFPAGAAAAGTCDASGASNWGEPDRGPGTVSTCTRYFPVIYAPGNLRLAGGRGQGVLLVRGDLDLSAGARFYGPVVVLGRITSGAGGGAITGAVLDEGKAAGPTQLAGSVIRYSSCAVARALAGSAAARPFAERAWSLLY